ncbi:MAG: hypothetical protein J7J91_10910 [Deltaproteobacteria bacterium]|nr:hypothetical protein [Deltaproteobacteria bacterium]
MSIGDLIDQLITANVKIFFIEEKLEALQHQRKQHETEELLRRIADLDKARRDMVNKRRMLINKINAYFRERIPPEFRTFEVE